MSDAPATALPSEILDGQWLKQLRRRIMSGEQVLATTGTEPQYVQSAIEAGAEAMKMQTVVWDCADGFTSRTVNFGKQLDELGERFGDPKLTQPTSALQAIPLLRLAPGNVAGGGNAIFVLHNFFPFFGDMVVAQMFENLVKGNKLSHRTADDVIVRKPIHFVQSPYQKLDLKGIETVRHWITPMEFPLPTEQEILDGQVALVVEETKLREGSGKSKAKNNFDAAFLRGVAASCRGLERHRVLNLLFYAVAQHGGLVDKVPVAIRKEAASLIAASTALEVVPDEDIARPEQLGGISNVIAALERAARTYTDKARDQFLDPASGLWFSGLPGTGKSEACKTSAVVFQRITNRAFTVLRVRMGALYGGIVGETEQNWYDIERRVEAFGPDTVVWLDELDKAFGNVMESSGDSGVRMGLFGLMLSWLSNPRRRCFVLAAMNTPAGIPGEMFRRFDDGFFFDLPTAQARFDIMRIHFRKRLKKMGKTLDDLGFSDKHWTALAELTDGWIPSELENLVKQSRDVAFEAREVAVPTYDEVVACVVSQQDSILSKQKKSQLDALRQICASAKPVDAPDVEKSAARKGKGNKRSLEFAKDAD